MVREQDHVLILDLDMSREVQNPVAGSTRDIIGDPGVLVEHAGPNPAEGNIFLPRDPDNLVVGLLRDRFSREPKDGIGLRANELTDMLRH